MTDSPLSDDRWNDWKKDAPTRAEFIELTEQIKANETLRDAAPDLLEACKEVIKYDNEMYKNDSYYAMNAELRDQIESAIAKAEGK